MAEKVLGVQNKTSGSNRRAAIFFIAKIAVILFLGVSSFLMHSANVRLKSSLRLQQKQEDARLKRRFQQASQKIYRDISEKYNADKVSRQALEKRLKIEQEKARGLEEKLNR